MKEKLFCKAIGIT